MKLIVLNTWGGRAGVPGMLDFFKRYDDVDFICLQEVWNGGEEMVGKWAGDMVLEDVVTTLFSDIKQALPNHTSYFRPHFKDYFGLTTFVHKKHAVQDEGQTFVYQEEGFISEQDNGNHARNLQYVTLANDEKPLTILNLHGLWNGKGKTDTEDRLLQSDKILAFVQNLSGKVVLAGDFNLLPDTESIAKLERAGLRNLITEYGITSTRTSFYTKPVRFADYIFVNEDVTVNDFKVLPDEVSDHAALYLDFS